MSDDLFPFEQEILNELSSGIPQLQVQQRRRRMAVTGLSMLALVVALSAAVLGSLDSAPLNSVEVAGQGPEPIEQEPEPAAAAAVPQDDEGPATANSSERGSRSGDSTSLTTTGSSADDDAAATDEPYLNPPEDDDTDVGSDDPSAVAAQDAGDEAPDATGPGDGSGAAGNGGADGATTAGGAEPVADQPEPAEPLADDEADGADQDDEIAVEELGSQWAVTQVEVRVDEFGSNLVDAYVTVDGLQPCESTEVLSNIQTGQRIIVQLRSSETPNCASIDPMQVVFVPLGNLTPGDYEIVVNDFATAVTIDEPFASITTTVELEYVANSGTNGGTIRLAYTPSEPSVCLSGSIDRGFTRVPAVACPEPVTAGTQWYGGDAGIAAVSGTSKVVVIDDAFYEFTIPTVTVDSVEMVPGAVARYESETDTVVADLAIAASGSTDAGCHDTTGLILVSNWVASTRHRIQPTTPSCNGGGPFAVTSAFGPTYQGYNALVTVNGESHALSVGGARSYPDTALNLDVTVEPAGDGFLLNLALPVDQQVPCSSVTLSQKPLSPSTDFVPEPLAFFAYEMWLDANANQQQCPRNAQSLTLTATAKVPSPGDYVVSVNGLSQTVTVDDPDQCVIAGVSVDSLMSREECSLIELTFTFDQSNPRPLPQSDPCTWEELRCNETGLVGVHLEDHWIRQLPPEFSQLTNLRYLGLVEQGYTEVPPEIAGLTNLLVLRLSDNGEMTMPAWIGNFQQLQLLEFERLVGDLPPGFFTLSQLKHLILAGAPVQGAPLTVMPSISSLPNLVTLDLSRSEVSQLPPDLAAHPSLRYLNVYSTRVTSEVAEASVGPNVEIVTEYLYSEIYRCRSADSVLELLDLYNPWDRDPLSACGTDG